MLNLAREEYERLKGWNQSTLKRWLECQQLPGEFKHWWDHRFDPDSSKARLIGRGLDCLMLEPERFKERFAVLPECDRRTKEGKEIWKAFQETNGGLEILTSEQRGTLSAMQMALMAEDSLLDVWDKCTKASIQGQMWGHLCKGEMDLWEDKTDHIWDIKALDDVSESGFEQAFFKWGYNYQATFYLALGSLIRPKNVFNFICVRNSMPYSVAVHSFCPEQSPEHAAVAEWSRRDLAKAMRELEARFNGKGFSNDPDWKLIRIPRWALMK